MIYQVNFEVQSIYHFMQVESRDCKYLSMNISFTVGLLLMHNGSTSRVLVRGFSNADI